MPTGLRCVVGSQLFSCWRPSRRSSGQRTTCCGRYASDVQRSLQRSAFLVFWAVIWAAVANQDNVVGIPHCHAASVAYDWEGLPSDTRLFRGTDQGLQCPSDMARLLAVRGGTGLATLAPSGISDNGSSIISLDFQQMVTLPKVWPDGRGTGALPPRIFNRIRRHGHRMHRIAGSSSHYRNASHPVRCSETSP